MRSLQGLTVLDLTRVLAGPYCTQILSDLGATVWKVEPPWGDDTRVWGPPYVGGESAYYLSTNRGKQSIAVNLKSRRGQAVVRELALRADVLVENFKPGDLARADLDYDSLASFNPGLVYASITGFGHTGTRADEPGYDLALQGMTGIMSVTGEPGSGPAPRSVAVRRRHDVHGQPGPELPLDRSASGTAGQRPPPDRALPGVCGPRRMVHPGGGKRRAVPEDGPGDRACGSGSGRPVPDQCRSGTQP